MAIGETTQDRSSTRSTLTWLAIFFALALGLRLYFGLDTGFDEDTGRYLYTGNDPYYHDRTVHHILDTGEHLVFDPAINYPAGGYNPNAPIFAWTTAPVAWTFEQLGATDAVGLALNVMVSFWGALTVIPVFMIGRDLWGRAAGLWAAFLMAFSAPHIARTVAGFPDHDAPTMFFICLAFAFMIKALKTVQVQEYVSRWSSGPQVSAGLRMAYTQNKRAFAWAALAGVALVATALTWKGYPYALAIMAIALGLQLLVDHMRNRDSTATAGLYLLPLFMVATLPWLLYYRQFPTFQDTTVIPGFYVLVGVLAVVAILVPTRNLPSVAVFPGLLFVMVAAFLGLKFLAPDAYKVIFSGLGYFEQTKLYSTIGEAQRAKLGFVAASFGFFTFLLVFWGLGRTIAGVARANAALTLTAAWTLVALFMTFRASRFTMNAAPIFSILIGSTLYLIVARLGLDDVRRRFRARHGQGLGTAMAGALTWKATVGTLLVGLFLILPNLWIGVDAAMPADYEIKNNLLDADPSTHDKFGAFGIRYELKNNGWLETMGYLSRLDNELPLIEERPAFIAWWDYGHWATGIGQHPTVADPFQNHFEVAGRFLASESEQEAVAFVALLLINNDWKNGGPGFSPAVEVALRNADPALLELRIAPGYKAEYKLLSQHVNMTTDEIFTLYDELQTATGKSIRYMAVDNRMYPSGDQPGIFYAPVYLSDKNPDDFIETVYTTQAGTRIKVEQYDMDDQNNSFKLKTPRFVDDSGKEYDIYNGRAYPKGTSLTADPETGQTLAGRAELRQTTKFTNSFFARAFGGQTIYSTTRLDGTQAGQAPGEGFVHWRAIQESSEKLSAKTAKDNGYDVNTTGLRQVVLFEYFSGVPVFGRAVDDAGAPMSGLTVTFKDAFGAGHDRATTDQNGRFNLTAPFSNGGDLNMTFSQGSRVLHWSTDLQFSREEARVGVPRTLPDTVIARGSLAGTIYHDLDGKQGYDAANDTALAGASVTSEGQTVVTGAGGSYVAANLQAGSHVVRVGLASYQNATQAGFVLSGKVETLDIPLRPIQSEVNVRVTENGTASFGIPLEFTGPTKTGATTNQTGMAQVKLDPGTYELKINHTGHDPVTGLEFRYLQTQSFDVPFGGKAVDVSVVLQKK